MSMADKMRENLEMNWVDSICCDQEVKSDEEEFSITLTRVV